MLGRVGRLLAATIRNLSRLVARSGYPLLTRSGRRLVPRSALRRSQP